MEGTKDAAKDDTPDDNADMLTTFSSLCISEMQIMHADCGGDASVSTCGNRLLR